MSLSILSRRQWILGAGALGATVALGGCASLAQKPQARVVVVGGGWGGLGAVRGLAASGRVAVTLIEPNERFMSCPLSISYIMGHKPEAYFQRGYERIDALGVRRVRAQARAIDRASKVVETTTGERIPYDFLVLSPGVEYMEEAIPGYAEQRDRLPVGFRMHEQAAVKAEVDRFLAHGGHFVITVPNPPYRCPPAPYERAMMIAEQIQKRRVNGKVVIVDANPEPTPAPTAKPILDTIAKLYPREIERLPETTVDAIDASWNFIETRAGRIDYRGINIVPPMRAPALIRQAGLGQRWADVAMPSFQSRVDPAIYVVGDAQGSPLPKSGHVAFGSGQQVAADILATIDGKPVPSMQSETATLPAGICWAEASTSEAIMINVTSTQKRGEAPQLRFQVDPIANANAKKGAEEWGQNMWRAMLG
ncbi:MAG: FAD-dependent oxidoreductase [Casimicrobiaceae bacterium]|nr:FAD-dependent oxidoreductase [Casimicrobiaceae bacterium]